jgi:hypothetical protein
LGILAFGLFEERVTHSKTTQILDELGFHRLTFP